MVSASHHTDGFSEVDISHFFFQLYSLCVSLNKNLLKETESSWIQFALHLATVLLMIS